MVKKILLFLLSLFVGIFAFFAVIDRIGLSSIIQALSLFSGWEGLLIFAVAFLFFLEEAWRWKFILKTQGHNLPLSSLGKIWTAGFSLRYLFPFLFGGAELFRAYSLRENFSVSWEKGVASSVIARLLDGSVFLLFLVFGFFSMFFLTQTPPPVVTLIVGNMVLLLSVLFSIFYIKVLRKKGFLKKILKSFGVDTANGKNAKTLLNIEREIFNFFSFKEKKLWYGFGLSFLRYSLLLLRCLLIIFFLGKGANIFIALIIYIFLSLAYLFPVPATLGTLEISQIFPFAILGLGVGTGAAFSLIWRGVELLMSLIGLVFLIKLGIGFLSKKIINKITSLRKLLR